MRNPNEFREAATRVFVSVELISIVIISFTEIIAFSILSIGAMVVYFALIVKYWTCPECKKMLPLHGGKIYVCPYCGYRIEEKKDD